MVTILIADDHEIVRRGLRAMIQEHEGWHVCGEISNGRDAVKAAFEFNPNVAVLDLLMPCLNGVDTARQIRRGSPDTEVLILADHANDQLICEALLAGARGLVLKSDSSQDLISAVQALSHHRPFFTSGVSEMLVDAYMKMTASPKNLSSSILTNREREIVQMIAEGKSNKVVAEALCISVKTVETHRGTVMRKLGINSLVHLVHYAIRNQLIEVACAPFSGPRQRFLR